MSKSNHLFLLADHIKLLLLERQRSQSLDLDSDTQEEQLSRSLEQFRTGLATLRQEEVRMTQADDANAVIGVTDALPMLQKQLDDLTAQFHGFSTPSSEATIHQANSEELADDFAHATSTTTNRKPKAVRFSDQPPSPNAELFGSYRDFPADTDSAGYRQGTEAITNQQLHDYHSYILDRQDEQLDQLGESIGRQRELSMQIGNELDNHVAMLDDVDTATDRHQNRLDRARGTLGKVARGAGEHKQMTVIVVLIIILLLLIAILK
ncbi:hypothetical protein DCS_07867 [Drechmeria coniospora]|uniref:t-SNARE coiled-coil homology domain-containing protein n=1 Tax=Drechmeria coniospora TaxID=98403 RepID=A0A151GFR1_DRECN|nr:hypothetical protein DCS_07867 [Drechmeria coniospora]KYK55902.1 hypothetical protein DCS_07867 [Drechmeria coniospora]ODA81508.1 hypothetical protein RJ55_00007 [Drechmeria coniospora]